MDFRRLLLKGQLRFRPVLESPDRSSRVATWLIHTIQGGQLSAAMPRILRAFKQISGNLVRDGAAGSDDLCPDAEYPILP